MMSFYQKIFAIGACQKKNEHFPEPHQKISNTVCGILFLNIPSHSMSTDFKSHVKIPTRSRIMMC